MVNAWVCTTTVTWRFYYDEPIIRAVTQYCSMLDKLCGNDVVLDVGSNVGVFSIEAAIRGAKVVAFEPCHDHVVIAKQHALLNKVSRKVVTKKAAVVGNHFDKQHVKLYLCNGRNNGSHTILPTRGRTATFVPCVTAQKAFKRKITAAKIDCEGAEYEFLTDLLQRCPKLRLLIVELHLKKTKCLTAAQDFVNLMAHSTDWQCVIKPNLKPTNWATVGFWEKQSDA